MAPRPTIIAIDDLGDLDAVLEVMADYARAGVGWINVQPDVPPESAPPPPTFLTWFTRRNTPDAALGTWTPPAGGQAAAPQYLGVQHRLGNRLLPLLGDLGLERPEGWHRVQDSPRRGLVMTAPGDADHAFVLEWLLRLTEGASTVSTTGGWTARAHAGRGR